MPGLIPGSFRGVVAPVRFFGGTCLVAALLLTPGCADDVPQRIHHIYDLKADPTEENRARIREMLADPDHDVRATAMHALVTLGEPDGGKLALDGLEDSHGFVRSIAAKLLGDLGDRRSLDVLIDRLENDPEDIVRQRAAEALETLGGEGALTGLARGLDDPMENVRLASIKGLRKLDPGFDVPALARLLLEDTSWEIRVQAATALGDTGLAEVRPVLEAALGDANEYVRSAAANALRQDLTEAGHNPPPATLTERTP